MLNELTPVPPLGHFMRKFQVEGNIAHQPLLVSKTRAIILSFGIKISAVNLLLAVHRCDDLLVLGMTALLFAVDADFSECVRELLDAGASPDGAWMWQDSAALTRTPLVASMLNNSTASLRLLLQAGCRLDTVSRTDDGEVVLPSELLTTSRCTGIVQRIVLTAATALGLQV